MKKALISAAMAGAACFGLAGPTGLYLMPIADILKHREAFGFVVLQGNERNVDRGYYKANALTVGLFDRVEIGYDNDFLGNTTWNAKMQLFESPPQIPGAALSVGVINAKGDHLDPYIVGRYDLKDVRLHAGLWRLDNVTRGMFGIDFEAFPNATASIEFLSGPSSVTWASIYYAFPKAEGLGLMISLGVPSQRSEGLQHAATLVYNFKF